MQTFLLLFNSLISKFGVNFLLPIQKKKHKQTFGAFILKLKSRDTLNSNVRIFEIIITTTFILSKYSRKVFAFSFSKSNSIIVLELVDKYICHKYIYVCHHGKPHE